MPGTRGPCTRGLRGLCPTCPPHCYAAARGPWRIRWKFLTWPSCLYMCTIRYVKTIRRPHKSEVHKVLQAGESMFRKVLHNSDHILHRLLPPVSTSSHNPISRVLTTDSSLPDRLPRLAACSVIVRIAVFYFINY